MRKPDLQAIRNELPHGAMSEIAEKIGATPKIVSEYFLKGWHQQYAQAILTEAIEIIRGKYPDEELMGELEELGLSRKSYYVPYQRKKKAQEEDDEGGGFLALAAIAGALALLFWPQIKNLISGISNKPTIEK